MTLNLNDIKAWLKDNDKESKELFKDHILKSDVKKFVESDEGWELVKSFFDSKVSKAVDTFKNDKVPSLIEKAIADKKPELEREFRALHKIPKDENPEIRELREKMQAFEKEAIQAKAEKAKLEKITAISKKLSDYQLNDFAEMFLDEDVEKTTARADKFIENLENVLKTKIEAVIGEGKYKPGMSGTKTTPAKWTRDEIKKLSPEEYEKHRDEINNAFKKGEIE